MFSKITLFLVLGVVCVTAMSCNGVQNKDSKCKADWAKYCTKNTFKVWMKQNCAKVCCQAKKRQVKQANPTAPGAPAANKPKAMTEEKESPEEHESKEEAYGTIAKIGVYPGYKPTGPPVRGTVIVSQKDSKTLTLSYNLYGVESASGGLHIHVGNSCANDAGDHYFDKAVTPVDPWTTKWVKDAQGTATGSFDIAFGFDLSQVVARTVVVHDGAKNTKVGCGVIEQQQEHHSLEEEKETEKESKEEKEESKEEKEAKEGTGAEQPNKQYRNAAQTTPKKQGAYGGKGGVAEMESTEEKGEKESPEEKGEKESSEEKGEKESKEEEKQAEDSEMKGEAPAKRSNNGYGR